MFGIIFTEVKQSMMEKIEKLIESIEPQLIADRRYFHQFPELSFQEENTADYICNRLNEAGISFRRGIAKTGILAEIQGKQPGKCLLIRGDMDALPITETSSVAYRSQNAGIMHACGHDAHMAILLHTCLLISKLRDSFYGTVKFAFQPGEETTGGAKPMIQEGILENPKVDACIALHMDSDLKVGSMGIKSGAMYASPDEFYLTIHGKSAHGAEPHNAIDPILIGAQIISQMQSIISRNVDPFENAVLSIGSIHGGDAPNIIPDTVVISGTARSYTEKMRNFLAKRLEDCIRTQCENYGATYEFEYRKLYPPLQNDPAIAQELFQSGIRRLGENNCIWGGKPTMAGEDFAYFANEVPSALLKLGCRNEEKGMVAPIHNSKFDLDETALRHGLAIFLDFALHFLN